jgi:Tfp pilus assembly protein PilN
MFLNRKSHKKNEEHQNGFHNPKILDVNLIKDERGVEDKRQKNFLSLGLVLFLIALFVAEIYFGLNWWESEEKVRAESLSVETAKAGSDIIKLQNQASAAVAYKYKSAAFTNLINNHIYWSNFFNWLEKNTLSTVKYTAFSGNLSGIYNLDAQASTYADISWQVKALLNDPLTQSVSVTEVTAAKSKDENQIGGVNFVLALKVKPEIFKK